MTRTAVSGGNSRRIVEEKVDIFEKSESVRQAGNGIESARRLTWLDKRYGHVGKVTEHLGLLER
jgi:hypothetical protein